MRRLLLLVAGMGVLGCSGSLADDPDISSGRLPPCPDRPNCVSSQAEDPARRIAPIPYTGSPQAARERLLGILRKQPRSRIVKSDGSCLQVEFKTAVMGFVDDALFCFDDTRKIIEVRSASRVGYSDLGVNRKRMERIRGEFIAP